ncbi:MAG: DUF1178 family protein [Sphingomonas sp.]|nr:DUF1178 family protein [Sphingomonas sp.]
MIVFDLQCGDSGDIFEAWFRSGADYDEQVAGGLVRCPVCQSSKVAKAPMAPRVPAKSLGEGASLARLAEIQSAILKDSEWVGDDFASEALSMHLGETESRAVHGNASAADAKALIDEGVPIAPLLLPVLPPNQVN